MPTTETVQTSPATEPSSRVRVPETPFWICFVVMGGLIIAITYRSFGGHSLIAFILQTSWMLWLLGVVMRLIKHRSQYIYAGLWVLLLWIPMCFQVVRRLVYWITIGMEPTDGMGSPLAFLIGFVFESIIFLPLSLMLLHLIRDKPWREVA
jgi:hypothetical protein